jgi:replicative DNA helicase
MNKPFRPSLPEPPHSIEAEQGLLGAILINNDALFYVMDIALPEHFFEPFHREIYAICARLISAGNVATPVTLKALFPSDLEICGLSVNQYLARLAAEATTIVNAPDYAKVICDCAKRRELIQLGEDIKTRAYESSLDDAIELQIEVAEQALYEIAGQGKNRSHPRSQERLAEAAIDIAARAYQRPGNLAGLSTGLADLDELTGGLQDSDLVIVAGRPGMGKTALATAIACSITRSGVPLQFFSLEMSGEQLGMRMIAERAGLPANEIIRGQFKSEDFDRLREVSASLRNPLYIDDSGGLSIAQLMARARREHRQRGIRVIVIDYLQLLRGTMRRSAETRVQEITEITACLKALAKELNVPVLALSQLSRAVENRNDKRPYLSDLRDSGTIEQDADIVLFVFREAYYHAIQKPDDDKAMAAWSVRAEQLRNRAEVIVAKHRHGPTGTVELFFEPELCRFSCTHRLQSIIK